jgi:hypothetical protein
MPHVRAKAFKLVKRDKKLVRFYLPLQPANPDDAVWLPQSWEVVALESVSLSFDYGTSVKCE